MRTGPHEALKLIAGGDRAAGLEALVAAVRRFEADEPGNGVDALCHLLEVYPELRDALRAALRELLGDGTAAKLLAETGILANTGFFTELGRRITGRLLPAPRDLTLAGQFGTLFDSGRDAGWLERLPAADGERLVRALAIGDDEARLWLRPRVALLDAIDLLSVRLAAMGVEPELQRHYRVPREHNNPFLAQNALLQQWLAAARVAVANGPAPDIADLDVLLAQCHDVVARVRRSARSGGASLRLTFLLQRVTQSLARLAELLAIAREFGSESTDAVQRRIALAVQLALAEGQAHDVGQHLGESTSLLALLTTENASRTGEHYVTRTRSEYLAMFRSALGAGGIIGLMAIAKMQIAALHLPPLVEALGFSLNYALGFVLIYVLHFTIATKQPAMTAQTIAAHLAAGQGRRADNDAVSLLVSRVTRTQLVAVLGNVMLAVPIALLATLLLVLGGSATPVAKTPHLLAELDPLTSPALFHAAIAGVWLFVSGLVTGYVDNLAVYERLADRIRRVGWLARVAGATRRDRFAAWMQDNLGGVAGNAFFGFALGLTGFVGAILGLPLDIRHVTFSAANFAIALGASDFGLPVAVMAVSLAGILLIALVNLAVSFALALWVALRARGQRIDDGGALLRSLARRLRQQPLSFLWPPRNDT